MADHPGWKTAVLLKGAVEQFIKKHGEENVGFYTITFPEKIDVAEASRRWNNYNGDHIAPRYSGGWIKVTELQEKRCCPHYHLLLRVPGIRYGTVSERFEGAFKGRGKSRRGWCCTSVGQELALERRYWLQHAPAYGFGRLDISPLHTSGERAASYISKYVSKSFSTRHDALKSTRLVQYGGGFKPGSVRFSSVNGQASDWRLGMSLLAKRYDIAEDGMPEFAELTFPDRKNPARRWAWHLRDLVAKQVDEFKALQPF